MTTPERLPGPSPESVEAALQLERSEVRLIQLGLAAEGFDPGGKDGWIGDRTRTALRQWQARRRKETTGHLDAESARLLKASGETREAEEEAQGKAAQVAQRQEQERQRAIEAARRKAAEEAAARRPIGPNWTVAKNQPCQIYNSHPVAGETITWSGSCTDRKASGEGRLVAQGSYGTHGPIRAGCATASYTVGGYSPGPTATATRATGVTTSGRVGGTFTWTSGSRYEGDFRDGNLHGRGVKTWASGGRYEGEYRDDKQHGRGTLRPGPTATATMASIATASSTVGGPTPGLMVPATRAIGATTSRTVRGPQTGTTVIASRASGATAALGNGAVLGQCWQPLLRPAASSRGQRWRACLQDGRPVSRTDRGLTSQLPISLHSVNFEPV